MKKKSEKPTIKQVQDGARFDAADIIRFADGSLKSGAITKSELKDVTRLVKKRKPTNTDKANLQTLIQKIVGVKSSQIGGAQWN